MWARVTRHGLARTAAAVGGRPLMMMMNGPPMTSRHAPSLAVVAAAAGGCGVANCRRWCATTSSASGGGDSAAVGNKPVAGVAASQQVSSEDALATLHEELLTMTETPITIGTLFQTLSKPSKNYLNGLKMPLETFLLRHPAKFTVFKQKFGGPIMVCQQGQAPVGAAQAVEKSVSEALNAYPNKDPATSQNDTQRVLTVLKYVPNEWVSYSLINIPETVRKQVIGKSPRKFFERNSGYFEVRYDPRNGHTFEIRRSLALQAHMAKEAAKNQQNRPR